MLCCEYTVYAMILRTVNITVSAGCRVAIEVARMAGEAAKLAGGSVCSGRLAPGNWRVVSIYLGLAVYVTFLAMRARDSAVSLESEAGNVWKVGKTAMQKNMGASLAPSTAAQYGRIWLIFVGFCVATKVRIF